MSEWKQLAQTAITRPDELAKILRVDPEELRRVHEVYPLRVSRYYLGLIREKGDPIWRQAIPDIEELNDAGEVDPLAEEADSPVPSISHRYPDRVLFYVSHVCATYCRFCTRKRKVGNPQSLSDEGIQCGLDYIRRHPEIRDVIVSGGDPLMLADERIDAILKSLRSIRHVEILRIGSRVPVTFPQRVTPELCKILKRHHPLFLNTHFNHPREITPESSKACNMLADAGIPLGNQSVLLKGVNDDPAVMKRLVQKLLTIRVRPYYIYQADLVRGTDHFRTSIETGLNIMASLRGHTSGLAVPHFVVDGSGGVGKIAIIPDPVVHYDDEEIVLKNYEGFTCSYPTHCREHQTDEVRKW
ncbi:MAG: KamA family radical SAM protein [Pirellulales bacterium]|nr:KamA family radical SAM protein [Pirellulales bacterium]